MSVKIFSTVTSSRTANPQQIAVMELEGYSWSTCSRPRQPRLVDCRIGVVNKLDRWRRRRRVLLTTRPTCRGEISKSGVSAKVPEIPIFPYNTVWDRWKKAPTTSSIRPVVSMPYRLVTDRQMDGQTDPATTACTALAYRRIVKALIAMLWTKYRLH